MKHWIFFGVMIALMMGLCGCVKSADTVGNVVNDNYEQYSNEKKEWYFVRNDQHEPSGAPEEIDLSQFNAIYLGDTKKEQPTIYLTFDCGYENGYTEKMLDVLKEQDVQALFFVTKCYVETAPEIVKRMKEEGHLVGNHTLNHKSMPSLSTQELMEEVTGLETLMEEKTGYSLDMYFRPPKGEYSERTLKIVKDLGYQTVFWSIAYCDYDVDHQPGKEHAIEHFNSYYHPGAIALLHTVSSSNADGLEEIIKNLKAQGYVFGTWSKD